MWVKSVLQSQVPDIKMNNAGNDSLGVQSMIEAGGQEVNSRQGTCRQGTTVVSKPVGRVDAVSSARCEKTTPIACSGLPFAKNCLTERKSGGRTRNINYYGIGAPTHATSRVRPPC